MWNRIESLIWKEFLAVLRDPWGQFSIFVPPILQFFIFAFAATLDVINVPIGILNQDFGEQSIELIQRFHGSPMFKQIVFLKGVEEIAPFIDNQKGLLVVSFSETFSRLLNTDKQAKIQLILDGRRSNSSQIASGYVTTIVDQFNEEFASKAGFPHQNTKLIQRYWFNPNLLYFWNNIPYLVGILCMLTCLIVTGESIARERELGTYDQLLVSPLLPIEILIGKIVPGIILGFIEGTLMMVAGVLILGVPFTGSLLLFFVVLFIFATSISGIGLIISYFSVTQQQSLLGAFVFIVPSVLLSGFATPIENMPSWLQPVAYSLPLTYMLIISKGLFLKAMPASIVIENMWPLLIIGLFTILGAYWLFRRRVSST